MPILSGGHLPHPVSTFVGRESEVTEVRFLLNGQRLVTLTGPGGSGKTRLALQVAGAWDTAADRTWLVELGALDDPALVPQAVAAALGVREPSGQEVTGALILALRSRDALLLLDNCEHLVAACAALVHTLLSACPALRVLATSREALGVSGEAVWPVPPLSLPPDPPGDGLLAVHGSDAVRLFVERAALVRPGFQLTGDNAGPVAHLCRQLDGLPLAIELAASRVYVLTPGQIAAQVDHALRLPGGSRTAPPRHRTLRAAVDWSHNLLDREEQALLARLAVFAGSFSHEAVTDVCRDAARGGSPAVLDTLHRLVDKSLVAVDPGDGRFRLLEIVRQYAREKLLASGEADIRQERHARFFLTRAETADGHMRGSTRPGWVRALTLDLGNLRAALDWARTHDTELGLRLAGALGWYWYFVGSVIEGRRWLEELLDRSGHVPAGAALASARWSAGALAWVQGEYAAARAHLDHSVALWRTLEDRGRLSHALTLAGLVTALRGEPVRGIALQEESVALLQGDEDRWGLALARYWLGDTHRLGRDHDQARAQFEASGALFRELGDPWGLSLALQGLGAVAYRQGQDARARMHLDEALALRRAEGDGWLIAQSLHTLGLVLERQGERAQAAALFGESLALYESLGDALGSLAAHRSLARLAGIQGDQPRAVRHHLNVLDLARRLEHRERAAEVLEHLATLARPLGEDEAGGRLERAAQTLRGRDSPWSEEERRLVATVTEEAHWVGQVVSVPHPVPTPAPKVRVFAFGPGRVEREGRVVAPSEWSYARVRELLFLLLCQGPRTREQIGVALWPDASPAQLRGLVHDALYHLRRALGDKGWIRYAQGRYHLDPTLGFWSDVGAFEVHLAETRRDPEQAVAALDAAVTLYQGDLLEDFPAAGWAEAHRSRWRQEFLTALCSLGELHLRAGRNGAAVQAFRRALGADAMLETAHRGVMRALAAQGEVAQAVRHYEGLRILLRDEVGVMPAPETVALAGLLSGNTEPNR